MANKIMIRLVFTHSYMSETQIETDYRADQILDQLSDRLKKVDDMFSLDAFPDSLFFKSGLLHVIVKDCSPMQDSEY